MNNEFLASFTQPSAPATPRSFAKKGAARSSSALGSDLYSEEGTEDGDILHALGLTTEDVGIMLASAVASVFSEEGTLHGKKMHANSIGARLVEVISTSISAKSGNSRRIGIMGIVTQLRGIYQQHAKFKTALYDAVSPVAAAHIAFCAPFSNATPVADQILELRKDPSFNDDFRFTGPFASLVQL